MVKGMFNHPIAWGAALHAIAVGLIEGLRFYVEGVYTEYRIKQDATSELKMLLL